MTSEILVDPLPVIQQRVLLRHLRKRFADGQPYWHALPAAFDDADADPMLAIRLMAAHGTHLADTLAPVMRPDVTVLLRRGMEDGDLVGALRAAHRALLRMPGSDR